MDRRRRNKIQGTRNISSDKLSKKNNNDSSEDDLDINDEEICI